MFDISGKIKLFAFDLDGTLYLGENLVPGALELISYLRNRFYVTFFTNNSSKTAKEIFEKLNRLGIKCGIDEVYAASSAAAVYLKESGIDNLFLIGSKSLRAELESNGLKVVDNDSADNVVVGLDFDFNYSKIKTALSVLSKGGKFIACNTDPSFPVEDNQHAPGCGAMVGAVAFSAGRSPDFIVGKPHTYILSILARNYKVKHDEIVVVGDSYESDIAMALNYGSKAILVNSDHPVSDKNVFAVKDINQMLTCMKESDK